MTTMLNFIISMSCIMKSSIPTHGKHSTALQKLNRKRPRVIHRIMTLVDVHTLTSGICKYVILRSQMDFENVIRVYRLWDAEDTLLNLIMWVLKSWRIFLTAVTEMRQWKKGQVMWCEEDLLDHCWISRWK